MTIFVSVASYRDPELVPTVLDCLAKADRPDELRIVVCWQHLGDEDVSALSALPNVELDEHDARASRGACWARAHIMRRYADEDWFFQVDSHTRFAPGWDTRVIAAARATGSAKPVVTCYPAAYEPGTEPAADAAPTEMIVHSWFNDGLPRLGQRFIENWSGPVVPARFAGACFFFAPGSIVEEVPYDPNLYFHGEELTLALRAYTWGYDLFHPTDVLAWHYYIREGSSRHWTDHLGADGARMWQELDSSSRRRVHNLVRFPSHGRYGVGKVRSVADYLKYSGCDLSRQVWNDPAAVPQP